MQLRFASGSNGRESRKVPYTRLVNYFVEELPGDPDTPYCLLPTPGMESFVSGLSGPVRGIMQASGILGGDMVAVLSNDVVRITSAGVVTSLAGANPSGKITPVRMAWSDTQLVFIDDGAAYVLTDAGTVVEITDVDLPDVIDVVHVAGYFVFAAKDSGRIYWSNLLDAENIVGTNFATAESKPDFLVGIYAIRNQIFMMGVDSVEVFSVTGAADTARAFQKRQGSDSNYGCVSRDSIMGLDESVFWLGRDAKAGGRVIIQFGLGRVSTHSVEDRLKTLTEVEAAAVEMWAYSESGHTFLMLDMGASGTWAFDLSTRQWHERESLGIVRYRANRGIPAWGGVYAADMSAASIVRLSEELLGEVGNEVRRVATATAPGAKPQVSFSRLELRATMGQGLATGQGSEPECMLRWSDDGGRTWSNEVRRSLGAQGQFGNRAVWSGLGRAGAHARVFEFAVSDPVNTSLIEAVWDE